MISQLVKERVTFLVTLSQIEDKVLRTQVSKGFSFCKVV